MCLITNNTRKYIAEEDIVCYKVVNIQDTKIISYWFGFPYELNRKYTTQVLQPMFMKNGTILIEEGFHSYRNLTTAKEESMLSLCDPHIIVKCIVPKGSEYYISSKSMVSNQIIIIEKCVQ